jgi:hypothetical protein
MDNKQIKKKDFIKEINNGGTSKEIASRLGITLLTLKESIQHFNLTKSKKRVFILINDIK